MAAHPPAATEALARETADRLDAAGWGPVAAAALEPLGGGVTNAVWRWRRPSGDLIVKRFRPDAGTPLFPNSAADAYQAQLVLRGTGLAPEPGALLSGDAPVLVYRAAEGGAGSPEDAGLLLAALHAVPPPAQLRALPQGASAILAQGEAMLAGLPGATALRALRPAVPDVPPVTPAFLHGDPVPANIVAGAGRAVLIDWQCPAVGDPCEDLACYLSPAMQIAYGAGPLAAAQSQAFLAAYGNPALAERLALLGPAFHWRMAAYCLWRAAHTPALAGVAMRGYAAEVAALSRA
jgi:hypothetical protein